MIGSMDAHFTEFGKRLQPHSESVLVYVPSVEPSLNAKAVLSKNIRALMKARYEGENISQFAKDTGIGLATVARIKEAKTSVGLDVIERIADKFDLQPWQLLVPNFDPANPPVLARGGLSEEQWSKVVIAAQTIAQYGPHLR